MRKDSCARGSHLSGASDDWAPRMQVLRTYFLRFIHASRATMLRAIA
jgi:hypothetical protein